MKRVDTQVRLQVAAAIRRELGDRPARIVVDGEAMDDTEVQREIERANEVRAKTEERRYQAALKVMAGQSGLTDLGHLLEDVRSKVSALKARAEQQQAALESSLDKLTWHGHEVGARARRLLDSDTSPIAQRLTVEVTLPNDESQTFEVGVHDKRAENLLRSAVVASCLAGVPPVPGWGLLVDTALSAVVAAAAVPAGAAGNKELRDALLRTAGKVFGLGAVGEIDVAGITTVLALATELRGWATRPVEVIDQAALDAFLNPPSTAATRGTQAMGWQTVDAGPSRPLPPLDRPRAEAPERLREHIIEKAVADRQATEASIDANASHHAHTAAGREALTWAFRALSTHPQTRSRIALQYAQLDEMLAGAEQSHLASLPVIGSVVAHARGHLRDGEISTMLGGESLTDLVVKGRAQVAANLEALGIPITEQDVQRAYDDFLAGADLR